MTGPNAKDRTVRKSLFRDKAIARLRGPQQSDTPDTITPWRPGLIITAGILGIIIAIIWMIP